MPLIHALEPGVGVDDVGNRGQIRKGNPRGSIATGNPLMRSLSVVVGRKSLRHLADFIQGLGTIAQQAFLIERAVIAFHKAILLWMMRIADEHGYSQGVTKAHEGSGEVAALWCSNRSRVSRSRVMEDGKPCSAKVCAIAESRRLCCKIGADMVSQQV
jgi:hypothetical protein